MDRPFHVCAATFGLLSSVQLGMATLSVIEGAGSGVWTDSYQAWAGLLGSAWILSGLLSMFVAIFGVARYTRVEGGSRASLDAVWRMFFAALFSLLGFSLVLSALIHLWGKYDGEDLSSGSTKTNPRDRLSGWRFLHAISFFVCLQGFKETTLAFHALFHRPSSSAPAKRA